MTQEDTSTDKDAKQTSAADNSNKIRIVDDSAIEHAYNTDLVRTFLEMVFGKALVDQVSKDENILTCPTISSLDAFLVCTHGRSLGLNTEDKPLAQSPE